MSKLQRRNASKELSILARLSDRQINTSDIPEIKDWARAMVGRFYKSGEQRIFPQSLNAGTFASDILVELESANIQRADATGITEMASSEIVKACIKGIPEAWPEFIRRYQRLIGSVVLRTSRQWGIQSAKDVENLIQEVYVRLCADDYRLLKMYKGDYEGSFFAYLKAAASNVAYDQLRSLGSLRRGNETGAQVPLELNDADSRTSSQEAEVLFKKIATIPFEVIDTILKTTASENERVIFWLYYREGFTAVEIAAALPTVNLTIKGVDSLLRRLRSRIASELTKQKKKFHQP